MDRLLSMDVFVSTVEMGSLTAAAELHGISPPMAGRHLRALEERIGSKLLLRTTRRQNLTEAGRIFYERSKFILGKLREAELEGQEANAAPTGKLSVGAPVSLGSAVLAPALVRLLAQHDELTLDLNLSDAVQDFVALGLDATFRIGVPADSSMVARPLAPYRMLICASPEYIEKYGAPTEESDLYRHQCLDFSLWKDRSGWMAVASPPTSELRPMNHRFTSNAGAALRSAAIAGFGLIMQPEVLLYQDVGEGRLVPVLGHLCPQLPVNLIYPQNRWKSAKVRLLIEFAIENFEHSWI